MSVVLERVRALIERHGMFRPGSRVGVAVSGGIDSVVLLHCLQELAPSFEVTLAVVHLNHRLRGEESEGDARFVGELAGACGLDFHSEAVDVGSVAGNLEEAGRDARRAFFARLRSAGAVDVIATGHTESDQAETVLYRLLRGAGTAGLSGIWPATPEGIVRPLLGCSRAAVEEFARSTGLSWREDRTNADFGFARNRIRGELLPAIQAGYSPAVTEILSATAELAQDEEDFWKGEIDRISRTLLRKRGGSVLLRANEISDLHPAVARRLIRRAVREVKGDLRGIDIAHVERLMALAVNNEGHGRVQTPGIDAMRSFEWLRLAAPRVGSRSDRDFSFVLDPDALRNEPTEITFPQSDGYAVLRFEVRFAPARIENRVTNIDELDLQRTGERLELRNWQPGDTVSRPGAGSRKLKTLFQDARVPFWERHTWPVLTAGSEIVWTRMFGVADGYKRETNSRTLLRIYEIEAGKSARYSSDTLT